MGSSTTDRIAAVWSAYLSERFGVPIKLDRADCDDMNTLKVAIEDAGVRLQMDQEGEEKIVYGRGKPNFGPGVEGADAQQEDT